MRDLAMLLQELEVLKHRMIVRKIELAEHTHRVMPGLDARKLDALVGMKQLAACKMAKKVKMPPRAAEFAIGRELQADRCLLVHDLLYFQVFCVSRMCCRSIAFIQVGVRLLDLRGPQ